MSATTGESEQPTTSPEAGPGKARPVWMEMIRLMRPMQWAKSAFVLIGPIYGRALGSTEAIVGLVAAAAAFCLASSAVYIHNDLRDRESDRKHPRKCRRPLASGAVTPRQAWGLFAALIVGAGAAVSLVPGGATALWARELLGLCLGLYVLNVLAYSWRFKHMVVMDVISLSLGFVLRVLGGCAALAVAPSSWLLNVTFFVAMFLSLGKRLGERRTLGAAAASARSVQSLYTDDMLRMAVVVTGVATLLTYGQYVLTQAPHYTWGFNLLWLTMLPATYGLLRAMVMLERGLFDDPTELATKDRPFQMAVLLFGAMTLALLLWMPKGPG